MEACVSLSGKELIDFWKTHDCPSAFAKVLNTKPDGTFGFNSQVLSRVQDNVKTLFDNYQKTFVLTDNTTNPKYNEFQDRLVALCRDPSVPGICETALAGKASSTQCERPVTGGFCSKFTREQIGKSTIISDLCGCYSPADKTYAKYIKPACDPLCHRAGTVQRADLTTGDLCICPSNVCVIDNVSINLAKGSGKNVNFRQLCPSCSDEIKGESLTIKCSCDENNKCFCPEPPGYSCSCVAIGSYTKCSCVPPPGITCSCVGTECVCTKPGIKKQCKCIISNVTSNQINDLNINFSQDCGDDATCFEIVENETRVVPCPRREVRPTPAIPERKPVRPNWIIWVIIGIIVVLIVVLIILFSS